MTKRLSFEERLNKCDIPLLKKLYQIILDKKSTLCVAADLESIKPTLELVDQIGPHICILKLHTEFFMNSNESLTNNLEQLYELKKKHNFLLFEDRKFADGGQTIQKAYGGYVKYVDLVTVLPHFGDGIFKAIESAIIQAKLPDDEPRGCLAVCELSFKGMISMDTDNLLHVSQKNSPICVGIIAQKVNVDDSVSMIKATPGVNISKSTDGQNQQWRGPDAVVMDGADIIIVGRGITSQPHDQWAVTAKEYKEKSYEAYLRSLD